MVTLTTIDVAVNTTVMTMENEKKNITKLKNTMTKSTLEMTDTLEEGTDTQKMISIIKMIGILKEAVILVKRDMSLIVNTKVMIVMVAVVMHTRGIVGSPIGIRDGRGQDGGTTAERGDIDRGQVD